MIFAKCNFSKKNMFSEKPFVKNSNRKIFADFIPKKMKKKIMQYTSTTFEVPNSRNKAVFCDSLKINEICTCRILPLLAETNNNYTGNSIS